MKILFILILSIMLIEFIFIFKIKEKFFNLYYLNYELIKKIKAISQSEDKEFFEIKHLLINILKIYVLILYPFILLTLIYYLANIFFEIDIINYTKIFLNTKNIILMFIVGIFYYKSRSFLSKKI